MPTKAKTQEAIMADSGYASVPRAAAAVGVSRQTIDRQIEADILKGAKAGVHTYVSVQSLLEVYAAAPLVARVLALGIKPVREHTSKETRRGKANA